MAALEEAKRLTAERDKIDAEIEQHLQVLKENNVTMDSPLVDENDFPIADIDQISVREARHKIICLRNDRKELTDQIFDLLQKAHEEKNPIDEAASSVSKSPQKQTPSVHRTSNTPFAEVSNVLPGSPASDAGLLSGDKIIQYATLHHGNFKDIKQLAGITEEYRNDVIKTTVIRNDRPVRLEIKPRLWEGKGLLGCAILPITTSKVI